MYFWYIMKIILDDREHGLFQAMQQHIAQGDYDVSLEKKTLEIGDIHLVHENREIVIIERKSLSDLIASIKDRRYEEQSHRLIHASGLYRHHIMYIIEGQFVNLRNISEREKKMVYSSMIALQLYKGFSVVRTHSLLETAEHIFYSALKLNKELTQNRFPWTPETKEEEPVNYCNFVSKVKRENIKQENIGEIMLSQIPGISSKTALAIMKEFDNFPCLIDELRTNPQCLDTITCETNGKIRKLGKNVKEGLLHYLT